MRTILLAGAAIAALIAGSAIAQEAPVQSPNAPAAEKATDTGDQTQSTSPNVETGAAAGIATGAAAGAIVGGPVGAVVGGFAGAILGTAASVPEPAVQYVVANPTEHVIIEGGVSEGAVIPEGATLAEIPDYPDYAYVYVDGRPVIVEKSARKVVYSPGYVVPERTVTYVRDNRRDPIVISGDYAVGSQLPGDVELVEIPDDSAYSYVYTDRGPVIVNRSTRTIIAVE